MPPLRILIAGGGTGGHVIPGLAIARALQDQHNAEVRFVGTARGLETKLVPDAGFRLETIHVGQLKGVSLATRVRTMADLPLGVTRCMRLLRAFGPHVVVGVGGYASGPAMMGALLLHIPTLAFEPNAAPGLANRLVGRFCSAAALNFAESKRFFRNGVLTGIPVRQEFFHIQARTSGDLRLLVFGGSQGARILNDVMPQIAADLLRQFPTLTIVHQAGGRHGESTLGAFKAAGVATERLRVQPYLDAMVDEIAAADVVLCRSGASTVAELAAAGRASVLVPFAAAADDHQRKNAQAFVSAGAALMVTEAELTGNSVRHAITALLTDSQKRQRMADEARKLAHPDAAERIATMCVQLARA